MKTKLMNSVIAGVAGVLIAGSVFAQGVTSTRPVSPTLLAGGLAAALAGVTGSPNVAIATQVPNNITSVAAAQTWLATHASDPAKAGVMFQQFLDKATASANVVGPNNFTIDTNGLLASVAGQPCSLTAMGANWSAPKSAEERAAVAQAREAVQNGIGAVAAASGGFVLSTNLEGVMTDAGDQAVPVQKGLAALFSPDSISFYQAKAAEMAANGATSDQIAGCSLVIMGDYAGKRVGQEGMGQQLQDACGTAFGTAGVNPESCRI